MNKYRRNFLGKKYKKYDELIEKIYKVLTNKKFRAGPLPVKDVKKLILEKIKNKISKNLPIKIFQFWGGSKNPNLPIDSAELCEQATLDNLKKLNHEITEIYKPGLKIFILPGDKRVQDVNKVPKKRTEKYIKTLTKIADKYNELFSIIPLSTLYEKYSIDLNKHLIKVKKRIGKDINTKSNFEKLMINAGKNIFTEDLKSKNKILERSKEAAKNYIIYRIAEEEAQIFRDYNDCIRAFFIRYIPFYISFIKDINKTKPRLDCSMVFVTGKKGNIMQPWQAIGKKQGDEILFLSQNRLNK